MRNIISTSKILQYGVPKGSVSLGPLLLSLLRTDSHMAVMDCMLYADSIHYSY